MTRFATLCMCLSLTVLPGCLPGDPTLPSVPAGYSSVPVGATPSGEDQIRCRARRLPAGARYRATRSRQCASAAWVRKRLQSAEDGREEVRPCKWPAHRQRPSRPLREGSRELLEWNEGTDNKSRS